MSLSVIPRDAGHPVDLNDPLEETMFLQHGCTIPDSLGLIDRVPLVPGGGAADRQLNLILPEVVAAVPPPLDPLNDDRVLPTPDRVDPVRVIERQMFHGYPLPVPGGNVEMWGFEDPLDPAGRVWPSKPIRVREGEIVHTFTTTRRGTHTIHHHGIEPTAMNDGVGHLTFEVGGGGTPTSGTPPRPAPTSTTATRTPPCTSRWGCTGCSSSTPPRGPGASTPADRPTTWRRSGRSTRSTGAGTTS